MVVSVSVLTPAEFARLCAPDMDVAGSVFLGSVFGDALGPIRERPRLTGPDRRLVGDQVRRFAFTRSPSGRVMRALPATREPCFPGPGNAYE